MTHSILTAELVRERLHYEPETGVFTWRTVLRYSQVSVGQIAGTLHVKGYIVIRILPTMGIAAHRLAWLYMTGEWPEEFIDHINGVRHDNRWTNLREATLKSNVQNQRNPSINNTTGFLGVSFRRGKYEASIHFDGKKRWLGSHKTAELAHAAYLVAKRKFHEGCTI